MYVLDGRDVCIGWGCGKWVKVLLVWDILVWKLRLWIVVDVVSSWWREGLLGRCLGLS